MNYKFALVTPFYNVEDYIDDCVKSVINQTYKNWIWIVTDDGSTDNTKSKLLKHCHENSNIIYYDQEYKTQIMKEISKFVPKECDYFIIMDSDDKMLPHCLEVYNKVLRDHQDENIIFFSCEASWVFDGERKYPSLLYTTTEADPEEDKNRLGANIWGCLRGFKNLNNFEYLGIHLEGVKEFYTYAEDYVFFIQSQNHGDCLTIKRNLYDFTRRSNSISVMNDKRAYQEKITEELIEKFKKENELFGKSIKTWERELFHDANSLLMGEFNFENKNQKINLFSKGDKNYLNLHKLYYDHDLKINAYDENIDFLIINCENFSEQELIDLFIFAGTKNTKQMCIYHHASSEFIDVENLKFLMDNYIKTGRYWCSHGLFSYHIYNSNPNIFKS